MKQKITIKVHARCDKCRTDAMKVAAAECGVTSVALAGEEKLVVIGDGVDAPNLTKRLYKKIGYAWLESVEEVKPKKEEEKKTTEVCKPAPCVSSCKPAPCVSSCKPAPCPSSCKPAPCPSSCKPAPCPPGCGCGHCRCKSLFAADPDPYSTSNCIIM